MNNNLKKELKNENEIIKSKINKKSFSGNYAFTEEPKRKHGKRKIGALIVSFALVVAIGFGAIAWVNTGKNEPTDFYLSFDINPSVEIVGEKGVVTSIKGLNEDGVILAKELKAQIANITAEDATVLVVEKAKALGYITDALPNGAIVVNVSSSNSKLEEKLVTGVTEKADKVLKDNNISGEVVSNVDYGNSETKKLAEKYGVTVGRMSMILNAVKKNPELKVEDLVGVAPQEINKIIKNYDQTKLDEFEDKLDALEDEYEIKLEEMERTAKENLNTVKSELLQIESEIMNAKTEEEFLAAKEKLLALAEKNGELGLKFDNINFNNRDNLNKAIEKSMEKAEEALELELEKMEEEYEKELDAQKKALKTEDDDDDDDDDEDDDKSDEKDDEKDGEDKDDDDKDSDDKDKDKDDKDDKEDDTDDREDDDDNIINDKTPKA